MQNRPARFTNKLMKYSCDEVNLENATITLSIRTGVSNDKKNYITYSRRQVASFVCDSERVCNQTKKGGPKLA